MILNQLDGTTYTDQLYGLDSKISDVIGFKTEESGNVLQVALKNPYLPDFNPQEDYIPFGLVEIRENQIIGPNTDATSDNWRFDFYLQSFPGDLQKQNKLDASDDELLNLTHKAWESFFDSSYEMTTYNRSLNFDFSFIHCDN